MIGRRELSEHLVLNWIIGPFLLVPFRELIRGKQMALWMIAGVVLVLPVVFFQAAHAIWRARRRAVGAGQPAVDAEQPN